MTQRLWVLGVAILTVGGRSHALTITPLTEGATLHTVEPDAQLFHEYGEGKMTMKKVPEELRGLPAIKAREPYAVQVFEIDEPARAYWVFHPRVYTPIPEDWEVFRQAAFVSSLNANRDRLPSDIYYRDLPAGRHEVRNPPNRTFSAGFKALSEMAVADCVLNIHSPTEEGIFRPGARVFLNVSVDNPTGHVVLAEVRGRLADLKEGTLAASASRGERTATEPPLPDLPNGFHLLDAELWIGEKRIDARRFPVAILDVLEADAVVDEPFFPVGAYNKFLLTHHREISRIYFHAICHSLREHNLNTLVGPALDELKLELDIAQQYGIRTILRVDQEIPKDVFGHPSILACMFGDEPKADDLERYKAKYDAFLAEHPERPLVSCMVGESVGSLTDDDPVRLWQMLASPVRMARFYPIRKADYDLLRYPIYKAMLPPFAAFQLIERSSEAPWWYVIQGFGGRPTEEKPDPYWRNPSPEEFTALAHLALANGARALISWPLQTHGPEPAGGIALIAQDTLAAEDDKYAAFAKVAADIAKAKELLLRHRRAGFEVRTDQYEVFAIGREDPETERRYVYLINMDAKQARTVKVALVAQAATSATDVYSGQRVAFEDEPPYRTAQVELGPGEGQFWELED